MKLKTLTESEAMDIALTLRGSITKKKLDRGIKKLRSMPNSFGAPYAMFFSESGQDLFRRRVDQLLASEKCATWHERRAFNFLMHDVLVGMDLLIKSYHRRRQEKKE
jgi:hypothetical protein